MSKNEKNIWLLNLIFTYKSDDMAISAKKSQSINDSFKVGVEL